MRAYMSDAMVGRRGAFYLLRSSCEGLKISPESYVTSKKRDFAQTEQHFFEVRTT